MIYTFNHRSWSSQELRQTMPKRDKDLSQGAVQTPLLASLAKAPSYSKSSVVRKATWKFKKQRCEQAGMWSASLS